MKSDENSVIKSEPKLEFDAKKTISNVDAIVAGVVEAIKKNEENIGKNAATDVFFTKELGWLDEKFTDYFQRNMKDMAKNCKEIKNLQADLMRAEKKIAVMQEEIDSLKAKK